MTLNIPISQFRTGPKAFTTVQTSLLVSAAGWCAAPDLTHRERVLGLLGMVSGLALMLMVAAEVTESRVSVDATVAQALLLVWGAQTARSATVQLLSEPCSCP